MPAEPGTPARQQSLRVRLPPIEPDTRVVPQDIEAEMSLIGSLLLDSTCWDDVRPLVPCEAFYMPDHRVIWQICEKVIGGDTALDSVTFRDAALAGGLLDVLGGIAYVVRLVESVPSAANAVHYAKIVNRHWRKRRQIQAADDLLRVAYDLGSEPEGIGATAIRAIESTLVTTEYGEGHEPGQLLDLLEAQWQAGLTGHVQSGFTEFDHHFGGWARAELTLVAARPSIGKTTFTLASAIRMARRGIRAAYLSLEMSPVQLAAKVVASQTGHQEFALRTGRLDGDAQASSLNDARQALAGTDGLLVDCSVSALDQVCARVRALQRERKLDAVFIDYLQRITGVRGRPYDRITEISGRLKELAYRSGLALIVACQLNREVERRPDKRPTMADLRDSGCLEEDAGVVVLLHRPGKHDDKHEDDTLQVLVDKNRLGTTGAIELRFLPATAQVGGGDDMAGGVPF